MEKKRVIDYVYEVVRDTPSRYATMDGIMYDIVMKRGKCFSRGAIQVALRELVATGRIERIDEGKYLAKH